MNDVMNIIECRKVLSSVIREIDEWDNKKAGIVINAIDKMLISGKDERRYNIEKMIHGDKLPSVEFYENETV